MSVAACLGFDDSTGPPLTAAATAWRRWCHQDPDLAVVNDMANLPSWTRSAAPAVADQLLARLHAMAQGDAEAASILAWLLLPGACSLAKSLTDLSGEIDGLIAGELWIRVCTKPVARYVAVTILRHVRRAVLVESGIGDAARRADPVWTATTTFDEPEQLPRDESLRVCAASEAGFLVQAAVLHGAITSADADLLLALAQAASELGAASRRGRGGLTAPAVIDAVTRDWPAAGRTVRRRAGAIIERLARFATNHQVEEDLHEFVATHELPPVEMAEFLELYLWDHIEEYLDGIHDEFDEPA